MQHFLLLLLLSVLPATAAGSEDLPTTEIEDMDGSRVAIYITDHDSESAPEWEPGQGAIPVSVDQAISAVTAWVKKRSPNIGPLVFSELVLKRVRSRDKKPYWHYLVRYRETLEDGSLNRKESIAAVLLDGEVVPVIDLPSL